MVDDFAAGGIIPDDDEIRNDNDDFDPNDISSDAYLDDENEDTDTIADEDDEVIDDEEILDEELEDEVLEDGDLTEEDDEEEDEISAFGIEDE